MVINSFFSPEKISKSTTKVEDFFLTDHESARKKLENESLRQDIDERKTFADRAFGITIIWIVFLLILTLCQFFLRKFEFGLSPLEFNIVFSTTTASVFGFWFLVGKYLFNAKK
jgi:hypothetical protein